MLAQPDLRLAAWAPALEFDAVDALAGESDPAARLPAPWRPAAPPALTLAQAARRADEAVLLAELGLRHQWLGVPLGAGRVLDREHYRAHVAPLPPAARAVARSVAGSACQATVAAAAAVCHSGPVPAMPLLARTVALQAAEGALAAAHPGASKGQCGPAVCCLRAGLQAELARTPVLAAADLGQASGAVPLPRGRPRDPGPWLQLLRWSEEGLGQGAEGVEGLAGLRLRLARSARQVGDARLVQRLLDALPAKAGAGGQGLQLAVGTECARLQYDGGDRRGAARALWRLLEPVVDAAGSGFGQECDPAGALNPHAPHACLLLAAWVKAGALAPSNGTATLARNAPAGEDVAHRCLLAAAAAAPAGTRAAAAASAALADWLLRRAGLGGGRSVPEYDPELVDGACAAELWAALRAAAAALAADADPEHSPLAPLRLLLALDALGGGNLSLTEGSGSGGLPQQGAGPDAALVQAELARVPGRAWTEVVPQLLARVQHPRVRPAAVMRFSLFVSMFADAALFSARLAVWLHVSRF